MKPTVISLIVKFVFGAIALGVGIWYMSTSIGGDSITYVSLDNFLTAIGTKGGDISTTAGCFLCGPLEQFFGTIGIATEKFWTPIVNSLWVLMAIGFVVFLFVTAAQHIWASAKTTAELDGKEKKIEFKPWFDKIWAQGLRILIVGALMGVIGASGTSALKMVTNVTVTPVMFVGAQLSMAATGVASSAQCGTGDLYMGDDVLSPVLKPFMCVMGNLNTVVLAGGATGFSLMNYAWMDMGGGVITWATGLALVIMFLIIGFNLFFQILSVIFKLIFLIIFLPIILAAAAFEKTWSMASGVVPNAIGMLTKSAIKIISITLKIVILYATVTFAADEYMPGPVDGYNAITPPLLEYQNSEIDMQTLSVINVFSECEKVSITNNEMDKQKFKNCFNANRARVERMYPGAFDFMGNGFELLILMIGLYLLYTYIISPKIDSILAASDDKEEFDFGGWVKSFGQAVWAAPQKLINTIAEKMKK